MARNFGLVNVLVVVEEQARRASITAHSTSAATIASHFRQFKFNTANVILSVLEEHHHQRYHHGSYEPCDPSFLPSLLCFHGYLVRLLSAYGAVLQGTSRGSLKTSSYFSSMTNLHLLNCNAQGLGGDCQ